MSVYFTDRDLGNQFPDYLKAAGLTVHKHGQYFAPTGSDEEWLEFVGRNGWVAVTHDRQIRYKENEKAAVVAHGVRLLVVIGHAPFPQLAKHFVDTIPRIETFLAGKHPPFIAKVYRPHPADLAKNPDAPGRIEHWFP